MVSTLTVLAPGLLGASVLAAVRERGLAERLQVWSRRAETRAKCKDHIWCDAVFDTPQEAAKDADIVIICAPVEHIAPLAEAITPVLKPQALVTDVGSTKSLICRQAAAALAGKARWVGSHPMAGSEKTGLENADKNLFDRQACFVTPLDNTPDATTLQAVKFWHALGMEVTTTSPEAHDEIVANISHLPHILASTLASYLSTKEDGWRNFAGSGLADTTRIAAGDPVLWKEIVQTNREEIIRALQAFGEELRSLERALHNKDTFELINLLERGQNYRKRLRPDS